MRSAHAPGLGTTRRRRTRLAWVWRPFLRRRRSVAHGSAGYGYHGSAGYSRAPAYGGAYHGGSYPGSGYRGYATVGIATADIGLSLSTVGLWMGLGISVVGIWLRRLSWYPWWGWGGWDNSYYNYIRLTPTRSRLIPTLTAQRRLLPGQPDRQPDSRPDRSPDG